MSETLRTLIESLFIIAAVSGGLIWYAVVAGRRESRDTEASLSADAVPVTLVSNKPAGRQAPHISDPDAHPGRLRNGIIVSGQSTSQPMPRHNRCHK
jgi:hypothetical protein